MQPDHSDDAAAFCLQLARAATTVARRLDSALGNHHGISFADYQLLTQLAHAPGGRLRRIDLAGQLGLTASGVTRSLLPLEKIGLVERQSDPRDARVGYALLSAAGGALLANADTTVQLAAGDAVAAIGAGQLQALAATLGRLAG
jgi:DNA-binding MarR family transcriptional regulator